MTFFIHSLIKENNLFPIISGIFSALSWGAGDFAGGLAARKIGTYRTVFFADLLGLLVLVAVNIFYREALPPISSLLLAGIAGICGSIGLMILYYSMANGQMSVAAPVSALFAAALPVIVGAFTQGFPTLIQFIGFGLALLAVWLISQSDSEKRFHLDHLSDLRLPLLAGLGFGTYFIIMHYATEGISAKIWPMIASRSIATVMLLVLMFIRRESFIIQGSVWGALFANGTLDVGGNFFYLLALQFGRLDISAILSSLYPGATVILAFLILKERISRTQWISIFTALAAIVLFTL